MSDNLKKQIHTSVLGKVLMLVLFSQQVLAIDCEISKLAANEQLQEIHNDLLKVASREHYEAAIHKRYDKVESLLRTANYCHKAKDNEGWQAIRTKLKSLRANARTLVFTKFDNWMQIKEMDSVLFEPPVAASADKQPGSTVSKPKNASAK